MDSSLLEDSPWHGPRTGVVSWGSTDLTETQQDPQGSPDEDGPWETVGPHFRDPLDPPFFSNKLGEGRHTRKSGFRDGRHETKGLSGVVLPERVKGKTRTTRSVLSLYRPAPCESYLTRRGGFSSWQTDPIPDRPEEGMSRSGRGGGLRRTGTKCDPGSKGD